MFGPPTGKINLLHRRPELPYIETYGTQNSIALHTTVAARHDLRPGRPRPRKEIVDVQIITAMNPTSGSFEI